MILIQQAIRRQVSVSAAALITFWLPYRQLEILREACDQNVFDRTYLQSKFSLAACLPFAEDLRLSMHVVDTQTNAGNCRKHQSDEWSNMVSEFLPLPNKAISAWDLDMRDDKYARKTTDMQIF